MSETGILLIASIYAVLATWAVCHWAQPIARQYRLMDYPRDRKHHRQPTPLIGGVAMIAVLGPIMPVFMFFIEPLGFGNLAMTVIAASTMTCALIGIADDRHSLSALLRLAAAVILFGSAIILDDRFMIDELRLSWSHSVVTFPKWVSIPFTMLILAGFLNCVNMADGKNGLVIGISLLWVAFLSIVSPNGIDFIMLPVGLMLLVLLAYNMKSRIFLGDGGSYGLASFFALTSIFSYNSAGSTVTADYLALIFFVPGIDMVRLVVWRILQGRSPFAGDRDHFHHSLFELMGWPVGLVVYLLLIASSSAAALIYPAMTMPAMMAVLLAYVLLILFSARHRREQRQATEQAA